MNAPLVEPFQLGDTVVQPGEKKLVELPVARQFSGTWIKMPVTVIHGHQPGPKLWLDAAIHGDELNGVEIVRQVLQRLRPEGFRGTLLAAPVVNVFSFIQQDRYLPDRRDLNRCFPGSTTGSLAARIAHLFLNEVVKRCDVGIDFHTGSQHRTNLPQIRANLDDPNAFQLAKTFDAPLVFHAKPIRGTLRSAANRLDKTFLLFEGGEPHRFNRGTIRVGVRGTLKVLQALNMWDPEPDTVRTPPPLVSRTSRWVRASRSGIFSRSIGLGDRVPKKETLGEISDPFSPARPSVVRAPYDGMVIGYSNNPLVHQGDALVHIAKIGEVEAPLPSRS